MPTDPNPVPVKTILATIGLILATVVAVLFVTRVERVLVWMLIALFFTVGVNAGIDFKGGTVLMAEDSRGPADIGDVRAKVTSLGLGDVSRPPRLRSEA